MTKLQPHIQQSPHKYKPVTVSKGVSWAEKIPFPESQSIEVTAQSRRRCQRLCCPKLMEGLATRKVATIRQPFYSVSAGRAIAVAITAHKMRRRFFNWG